MIHISDWLPTLLEAAGYDMTKIPCNLDGHSQWQALSHNSPGPRQELLHNIDPVYNDRALRVGHMKVVKAKGPTNSAKGWYRPYNVEKGKETPNLDEVDDSPVAHRVMEDSSPAPEYLYQTDIPEILKELGRPAANSHLPYVVQCGAIPPNVTTNCKPAKAPCLFNVTADPCEYHNLADKHPDILKSLLTRLDQYEAGMVAPRNKDEDPAAYPSKHGGVWVPWIKLNHTESHHDAATNNVL